MRVNGFELVGRMAAIIALRRSVLPRWSCVCVRVRALPLRPERIVQAMDA